MYEIPKVGDTYKFEVAGTAPFELTCVGVCADAVEFGLNGTSIMRVRLKDYAESMYKLKARKT